MLLELLLSEDEDEDDELSEVFFVLSELFFSELLLSDVLLSEVSLFDPLLAERLSLRLSVR